MTDSIADFRQTLLATCDHVTPHRRVLAAIDAERRSLSELLPADTSWEVTVVVLNVYAKDAA